MIDSTDRQILAILQENARTANAEIARRVGLAASAVFERIRKMEERGVIEGYGVRIDPRKLDLGLLAFVYVRSDERTSARETEQALAAMPEVQEVHHIAGEDCFLVKTRTRDTAALGALIRERIGALEAVRGTRTTIVLETIKESGVLPLEETGDAAIT